jgi:hypothetical protein
MGVPEGKKGQCAEAFVCPIQTEAGMSVNNGRPVMKEDLSWSAIDHLPGQESAMRCDPLIAFFVRKIAFVTVSRQQMGGQYQ